MGAWIRRTVYSSLAIGLAGCLSEEAPDSTDSTVQQVRTGDGGYVGLDVLVTGRDGEAVPCDEGTLDIDLRVSRDGEAFAPLEGAAVHVACADENPGDVAIVVDNSGSQEGDLDAVRAGSRAIVDGIVGSGGRASLVRVSTEASVLAPLTEDADALDAAVESMHISNGWTALYDGIRAGNETLGRAAIASGQAEAFSDARQFCTASRKLGIVAFTDGQENNSAGQQIGNYDLEKYPGDGIHTTLYDLHSLRVDGVTTPIYTVGLGDEVNHAQLSALADYTGGRHRAISSVDEVEGVLDLIGDYFGSTHQICAELPDKECGDLTLRFDYTWTNGAYEIEGSREARVRLPCPATPEGRTATVLMTMSNPGIPEDTARTLAAQGVSWVSPRPDPRVLVVRDDNHHGEYEGDPLYVHDLLGGSGFAADFIEEPPGGLRPADVADYDVVWFSNPGYPIDSQLTFETLQAFSGAGGGVVLQGDDMSWSFGHEFAMTPMTHLEFARNGTFECEQRIDKGEGGAYQVALDGAGHPLTAGLDGTELFYDDDIDVSFPVGDGERVLTTATVRGADDCELQIPVIVASPPTTD